MSETQAKETEIEISTGPAEVKPEGFVIEADGVGVTSATVMDEAGEVEITEPETDEPEVKAEPNEPIEIKVEEDTKPVSRRLSRFDKRLQKKQAAIDEVLAEKEALEEQVKLYEMRDRQASIKEPDEDTFEGTHSEFQAAVKSYQQQEVKRLAAEQAQEIVDKALQQTTQRSHAQHQEELNKAHYQRADSLRVKNYDQLEGNAVDIIGDDFAQVLIASTDNAHRILASMGANPGKAAQIAQLARSNPSKAFADALLFEIHPSLSDPAPKTTLDPETMVDPGRGITSNSQGLEGVKFE